MDGKGGGGDKEEQLYTILYVFYLNKVFTKYNNYSKALVIQKVSPVVAAKHRLA